MADSDFRRLATNTRQLLATVRARVAAVRARARAHPSRPADEVHLEIPRREGEGEADGRIQERILLDAVGGHALLTTVEDSIETMLEILGEMGSLLIARCRCEGDTNAQDAKCFCSRSGTPASSDSDPTDAAETCRCVRLGVLQYELRDLMKNTRFDGMPLLDVSSPPPPLFIDLAPETALRVGLESPGPALSSVVNVDVDAVRPNLLGRAVTEVHTSMNQIAALRSRLKAVIEDRFSSAPRRGRDSADLPDADSVRAQLSAVGRRIAEDAIEAVLAQANAERRLIDFLYRNGSAGTLTRIYPLSAAHDSEPDRANSPRLTIIGGRT